MNFIKNRVEIEDYYLKEYEQLHSDSDKNGNIISMTSYGYYFINDIF